MTPPKTSKADVKNQLLLAGIQLIQRNGYHGTGLQELVKEIGVPKGSFYYYFNSKEEFIVDAILTYISPFLRQLEDIENRNDENIVEQLHGYFQNMVSSFEENANWTVDTDGNLLGEIGDTSEVALDALDNAVTAYRGGLRRIIAIAQSQNSIRVDIDSEQLANLLFDAWQGALLRMKVDRSTRPLTQFVDITFNSLLLK